MKAEEYRAARKTLGMTQQQLADAIGRHKSIISKRERGLKPITWEAEKAILCLVKEIET